MDIDTTRISRRNEQVENGYNGDSDHDSSDDNTGEDNDHDDKSDSVRHLWISISELFTYRL